MYSLASREARVAEPGRVVKPVTHKHKAHTLKDPHGDKSKDAHFFLDARYEVQAILGRGSYGTVCSAIDISDLQQPVKVAVKKVTSIFERDVLLKRAIRELKFMKFFKGHKNIINLYDLDICYDKPYEGLYCIQEFIDYDLAKVIHSSVQFSEFHIQNFTYQILCGLKYIHSADVIHRDLKPGNILCTAGGNLKICDFGLARGIAPQYFKPRANTITNYVATRWYRAPELILSHKNYSKSIDMWAVGCIVAEFYGRKPLFMGVDQMHQVSEIVKVLGTPPRDILVRYGNNKKAWDFFTPPRPQYKAVSWDNIYPFASDDAYSLLENLLIWDAQHRFTVEQCLEHSFLKSVRDVADEPGHSECFDFSYETRSMNMDDWKRILQEEVKGFRKRS